MLSPTATDDGWRGFLLTFALASCVGLLIWWCSAAATAPSASISEEERRARRERLAALAERRAEGGRAQETTGRAGNVVAAGRTIAEEKNRVAEKGASDVGSAGDVISAGAPEDREESIDSDVAHAEAAADSGNQSAKAREEEEPVLREEDGAAGEGGEMMCAPSDEPVHCAGASGEEGVEKADDDRTGDAATADHDAPDAGASEAVISVEEAGDAQQATNGDEKKENQQDGGHRERHAKAIAKILAKKKEQPREAAPRTLTVYLILTSVPGAPRVELSVPETATAESLVKAVSKASGVPESALKVIFRGRMIARQAEGKVTKEFGIEEGCALHVVGKPGSLQESEDEGESESESESSYDPLRYLSMHWDDLPDVVQRAAEKLGHTAESWEADEYGPFDFKLWTQLTVEQQQAAHILGFNMVSWDAQRRSSLNSMYWDELPDVAQRAAETLGYTAQIWNDDEDGPFDDKPWTELTAEQQRAALILGYDSGSWNEQAGVTMIVVRRLPP